MIRLAEQSPAHRACRWFGHGWHLADLKNARNALRLRPAFSEIFRDGRYPLLDRDKPTCAGWHVALTQPRRILRMARGGLRASVSNQAAEALFLRVDNAHISATLHADTSAVALDFLIPTALGCTGGGSFVLITDLLCS
jgi:hypothetical protein